MSVDPIDEDRYLITRGRRWHYVRRVPKKFADVDPRGTIRCSLDTTDKAVARVKRDEHEAADDLFWQSLVRGDHDAAGARYDAAVRRAKALDVPYRTAEDLATSAPLLEILQRTERLRSLGDVQQPNAEALLGGVRPPRVTISRAIEVFLEQMAPDELRGKSANQKRKWINNKRRPVGNFVNVVGDLPIDEITREHALAFYQWWLARITPDESGKALSWSAAKREIGDIRKLYADYFTYYGEENRPNPFRKLTFKRTERPKRPSFSVEWIKGKILVAAALEGLNVEARLIVLILIETGARPSEIANLMPDDIRITDNVPHIRIAPTSEREIKTSSSVREIPLIGIALEAMRLATDGFPRYHDRGDVLSATLNKFFRENHLFPTAKHTIYSFRHAFEDRMKEAGIDYELRCELMGHDIDRPDYGEGGSMAYKHSQLSRIRLDFPSDLLQGVS